MGFDWHGRSVKYLSALFGQEVLSLAGDIPGGVGDG